MSSEVRLRSDAEQDLSDAASWYQEQMPGLGHDFLDAVMAGLDSIARAPHLYPIVHRNTRRMLIHRFPFGIYYLIEDPLIVVLAVMHGSRDPERWKTRE